MSATFPAILVSSLNLACNLWVLQWEQERLFVGVSHYMLDRKHWHFSVRYSVLFAFDSDTIIASLSGFKEIFHLSSQPKRCFIEEARLQWSNTNVLMTYCSSERTGFAACWIPSTAAGDPKQSLKWDELVTGKTLHGLRRWEHAAEQNASLLFLQWPTLVQLFPLFSNCVSFFVSATACSW